MVDRSIFFAINHQFFSDDCHHVHLIQQLHHLVGDSGLLPRLPDPLALACCPHP